MLFRSQPTLRRRQAAAACAGRLGHRFRVAAQDLVGRRLLIGPDGGGNFWRRHLASFWLLAVFALAVAAVIVFIAFIVSWLWMPRE